MSDADVRPTHECGRRWCGGVLIEYVGQEAGDGAAEEAIGVVGSSGPRVRVGDGDGIAEADSTRDGGGADSRPPGLHRGPDLPQLARERLIEAEPHANGRLAGMTKRPDSAAVDVGLAFACRVPGVVADKQVDVPALASVVEDALALCARAGGRRLRLPLELIRADETVGVAVLRADLVALVQVDHQDGVRRTGELDVAVTAAL